MKCHITSLVPQTALLNIYSYVVRLCKSKAEFKPKEHLPKDEESVSQRCLPQHRNLPFQGCFEKENRRKPWTNQDGEDEMLMAGMSQPTWSPESLHYGQAQSFGVDFSRPSAQITDGQPGTLLFVSSRSLPWNVPWVRASQPRPQTCWKLLREQCHPLLPEPSALLGPGRSGVKLLWKRSWSFSISSYESLRSCRCNQSYFFFLCFSCPFGYE